MKDIRLKETYKNIGDKFIPFNLVFHGPSEISLRWDYYIKLNTRKEKPKVFLQGENIKLAVINSPIIIGWGPNPLKTEDYYLSFILMNLKDELIPKRKLRMGSIWKIVTE